MMSHPISLSVSIWLYWCGDTAPVRYIMIEPFSAHLVSYKQLRADVRFVQELPKTASGKLLRKYLRDKARKEMQERKEASKI